MSIESSPSSQKPLASKQLPNIHNKNFHLHHCIAFDAHPAYLSIVSMPNLRHIIRAVRPSTVTQRPLSTTIPRTLAAPQSNETASEWRESQKSKPTGPHMTNTNSTIANEMPSVGADKAPPELITSVDPDFTPKDSVPENTERMTGGTQKGGPDDGTNAELDVGQMEGAKFKVEPIRRTGEDGNTMRARLLCLFHKRFCYIFQCND